METEPQDIPEHYLLNDQPMICGNCGARTSFEVLPDKSQLHECLNKDCGYEFIAVDDE